MMFLDRKDPVVDIKELLYKRKAQVDLYVEALTDAGITSDARLTLFQNESTFIANLLDIIERS